MKLVNRGLALLLAAVLAIPTLPARAEELPDGGNVSFEQTIEDSEDDDSMEEDIDNLDETDEAGEDTEIPDEETGEGEDTEIPDEETEEEDKIIPDRAAEVRFNTGNCEFSIVDLAVSEEAEGDGIFEEDGSFTINIPEENPFFPYEVQFICDGETTTEWFMTPDDTVEIGGHTFYVSAYMDGTVITQMNLEIGGKTVIGYPARKEFTNGGGGGMPASILPLETRTMNFDLYNYTPVELSMMQVKAMITPSYRVLDTDNIIWHAMYSDNNYRINAINDRIDLSYRTYYGGTSWEMFVGESDQLADSNIRYVMDLNTQNCSEWLMPMVYTQDVGRTRTNIQVASNYPFFIINLEFKGEFLCQNWSVKKYKI